MSLQKSHVADAYVRASAGLATTSDDIDRFLHALPRSPAAKRLAASLLDRASRTVVTIDDEWAAATKYDALGVSTD